jgi:hypothetical protein
VKRFGRRSGWVLFFIMLTLSLFGREVDITVEDADLSIPLEGAVIRIGTGTESVQYVCDEDGRARITLPDGRPALIQAAYPGYENRRLSIAPDVSVFTVQLKLGGIMENRELVLEASRPGASETRSGRSVAISGEELTRTAEIGIIEDVMSSIKLLPGVGYAGMFNAMPSIRGGDPGDLMAVLDGFYISNPYHWGGGISIFDPKMISSAQLSHGVFSTRYGHTISGLLEITSKKPNPTETEVDLGLSTSTTNLNISFPLWGKGGVLVMGRVTYWDPLVWAAKALATVWTSNEPLQAIHSVSTAPYIRSGALSANYRFTTDTEFALNGFFGTDGVGAAYRNDYDDDEVKGDIDMDFDYHNYQGFGIGSFIWNPIPSMVLRTTAGAGFTELMAKGAIKNDVTVAYNQEFLSTYGDTLRIRGINLSGGTYHAPDINAAIDSDNKFSHAQGRVDLDWDLGKGFLIAGGVQELFTQWQEYEGIDVFIEQPIPLIVLTEGVETVQNLALFNPWDPAFQTARVIHPFRYEMNVKNEAFMSSAYSLLEYKTPNQRFGGELGFRVDHIYFIGNDTSLESQYTLQTAPALNPRLNVDFGILNNYGPIDSLTATVGTGLFSSINDSISFMEQRTGLNDFDMKPNRSWTSVLGTKIDFGWGISFNIEGYYKYVFDRAYITTNMKENTTDLVFNFDGEGRVWGFDFQLMKLQSRYWDGWISYTFTHARYREPSRVAAEGSGDVGDNWYWPSFHRFHNFNLVFNFKPIKQLSISGRFGFASGNPVNKVGEVIAPYPVEVVEYRDGKYIEKRWDEDSQSFVEVKNGEQPTIIQKFRRESWYDDNERSPWALPLDIKISFYIFDRKGRVQTEIYLATENLLSLVYTPQGNVTFNDYTGRVDAGANVASYGLPIPMVSFGFKWSY